MPETPMMDGSDLSNFVYGFDRNSSSTSVFGSTDVNVDYQHSTHKKDELLTFSYRFSHTPNNNESYTDLENIEGIIRRMICIHVGISTMLPLLNIQRRSIIQLLCGKIIPWK